MLGLRTKEKSSFERFFTLVQDKAKQRDAVFFLDFGECKDIAFNDLLIDDLCGWLIPVSKAKQFNSAFSQGKSLDQWSDFITWCLPEIRNDALQIEFKQF